MKPPASAQDDQEQIAQLRHDLLTPLNQILGFTEIQIEEAEETGIADCVPALTEINAGGRSLLAAIQQEFDPGSPDSDLARLSARIEAEAGPVLGQARKLAERLQTIGRQSVADEVELVACALESLVVISRQRLREIKK